MIPWSMNWCTRSCCHPVQCRVQDWEIRWLPSQWLEVNSNFQRQVVQFSTSTHGLSLRHAGRHRGTSMCATRVHLHRHQRVASHRSTFDGNSHYRRRRRCPGMHRVQQALVRPHSHMSCLALHIINHPNTILWKRALCLESPKQVFFFLERTLTEKLTKTGFAKNPS